MDEKIKTWILRWANFFKFQCYAWKKSLKKILLGLFFRDEICFIFSSSLYKSILCMFKRTN